MEPSIRNLGEAPRSETGERPWWLIRAEDGAPNNMMIYLEVEPGEATPLHTHAHEHSAFILRGSGVLYCGGKEYPLKTHDAVLIPPDVEHQIRNTGTAPMGRLVCNPLSAFPAPR